jgi:Xaa-Pro dipeptidase
MGEMIEKKRKEKTMNIFSTSFDYQSRLNKVRKLMDERDMDAILVHLWPNQYFISGMYPHLPWYPLEIAPPTESPLILFRDRGQDPVYMCYYLTSNALKEATWIKDLRIVDIKPMGKLSWWEYTAEVLREKGVDGGTIGIEKDACVLSTFEKLKSVLPKAQFKAADEIFQLARKVKEPEEIKLIKEAVLIAEAGLKAGMEFAKVGVLESEIQQTAEMEMKRRGAIREFETMVQSGARTANYRAMGANWKRVEENDLVAIDIGCIYKGYCSDITRTWSVGKPTAAQKKITRDVAAINDELLAFMKPGLAFREIAQFGKKEVEKAGYLTDRTIPPSDENGIGEVTLHGVGLGPFQDVPYAWDWAKDFSLEIGMVISVTVGVRHATSTIRFEDNLVMTPAGPEVMNKLIPWQL